MWVLLAFLAGSLPFSYWIGRYGLRRDIRSYGDGNPGATNVIRAGGKGWAALAFALDYLKGAVPVGLAYFAGQVNGIELVLVALAPVLGHAFSPFLGFKGGKAVAATFGIWTGLTIWEGPTVLGLMLLFWYMVLETDGWAVLLTMASLLLYLMLTRRLGLDSALLAVWIGNAMLLAWTHRRDLLRWPLLRPRLKALRS